MLKNISQVKKYEQSPKSIFREKMLKKALLILLILVNFIIQGSHSQEEVPNQEKNKNSLSENPVKETKLPLEISEKYYKKEAIVEFNKAVASWEEGNVDQAITFWKKSIEIDSILWVAYLGLGQAYEKKQEFKKALDSYSEYLKLAPPEAPDRENVKQTVQFLSHLLRHGEENISGGDYLPLVKTKHEGKELYVRFNLNTPLNIYFFPTLADATKYPKEFENAFLAGADVWMEALPKLKFKIVDNSQVTKLSEKEAKKKEKEILENTQIRVVFPSKLTVKSKNDSSLVETLDAYSYPIIRDKKNFRVLGKIMVSPYIYFQSQIALPLEPLSKLEKEERLEKVKLIAAREVGHALGLWGFSPNPNDFMFEGEVKEIKLTERDKNTIQGLYELNPKEKEVLTNK
ncbi:MAG: hypothetical protein HYR97_05165 [Candidatus Melainabacteria bacterium]|nr:hypothetical protein [Candidatus Melainabacteria bacterium]MBI3308462.1 hypothetical protein [Candidatus Melainabacteria bacterium]